jgi:hypothetical protein
MVQHFSRTDLSGGWRENRLCLECWVGLAIKALLFSGAVNEWLILLRAKVSHVTPVRTWLTLDVLMDIIQLQRRSNEITLTPNEIFNQWKQARLQHCQRSRLWLREYEYQTIWIKYEYKQTILDVCEFRERTLVSLRQVNTFTVRKGKKERVSSLLQSFRRHLK